jgi:hypothetical protein
MSKSQSQSTAGQWDPYWYEGLVGLREVVSLLDAEGDYESIAFQSAGVKGWDDVIVRRSGGRRICYQVKHSRRAEQTLSFGDLVSPSGDDDPLLKSLFRSWLEGGLNDSLTTCVLYTNRDAGTRWWTSTDGTKRPPLLKFWKWLKDEIGKSQSLGGLTVPNDFAQPWETWVDCLSPGSDLERFEFLKALEIRDAQDDLEGLSESVHQKLASAFGVSVERAAPLFDALHRALLKWTTGHKGVTVEELCTSLALPAETVDLSPAPPPPAPFFPSRLPFVEDLHNRLSDAQCKPVVFLSAEPGGGKTSVLSQLANRRTPSRLAGIISVRFFCFEPIRPEAPVIAPDASRVHPKDLWFSLLAQLREGLRGRLHELRVPLRNDLLTWQDARGHVLRLADYVGAERGRRVVILVDGIDHAARASQTVPEQSRAFLKSFPTPTELQGKAITLLLAGQPPAQYFNQYPTWLQGNHSLVDSILLPPLESSDVTTLYTSAGSPIPAHHMAEAIRAIETHAKGNTLATVFAVREATQCSSLFELAQTLERRRLADGLEAYYSSLWSHMLSIAGGVAAVIDIDVAGALSFARRAMDESAFASAFEAWEQPSPWWRLLLESLGPLLMEGPGGFRVRHNDVRVFLASRFATASPQRQARTASFLADHFSKESADRYGSHLQLFDLLSLANRSDEHAARFNTEWVFEAAAFGVDSEQLRQEGRSALLALQRLRNWNLLAVVACGLQTLHQLIQLRDYVEFPEGPDEAVLPPFLPTESAIPPVTSWSSRTVFDLCADATRLAKAGESDRGEALLSRWLDTLEFDSVVDNIRHFEEEASSNRGMLRPDSDLESATEELGRCCARFRRMPLVVGKVQKRNWRSFVAFERGYAEVISTATANSLAELLAPYELQLVPSWKCLLQSLSVQSRWSMVREVFRCLADDSESLSDLTRAEASWWALVSDAAADNDLWLSPLDAPRLGLESIESRSFGLAEGEGRLLNSCVNLAKALGWSRPGLDAGDIGTTIYNAAIASPGIKEDSSAYVLLFRAAALVGRITRALKKDVGSARALVTDKNCRSVLTALWGNLRVHVYDSSFQELAASLVTELAELCRSLGGLHAEVVHSVARLVAQEFPSDKRRLSSYLFLDPVEDRALILTWCEHWIGKDGEVWHGSRDQLRDAVHTLSQLADFARDPAKARVARDRVEWNLIGYGGRKEYAFEDARKWYPFVAKAKPALWDSLGWALWNAVHECERQGGDNRIRSSILDVVASSAFRSGPGAAWRLLQSQWPNWDGVSHNELQERIVGGIAMAVNDGMDLAINDLQFLWAIAQGLSVSYSQVCNDGLAALRSAITTRHSDVIRSTAFESRMSREVVESRVDEAEIDRDRDDEREIQERTLEGELQTIREGQLVRIVKAAKLLSLAKTSGCLTEEVCDLVLSGVTSGDSYPACWHHLEDGVFASLRELTALAWDNSLWSLFRGFLRDADRDADWTYAVYNNMLEMAFARAERRDSNEAEPGLAAIIGMHELWALGAGPHKRARPGLNGDNTVQTWRDFAIASVCRLLESDDADVLYAAVGGLHSLVDSDPSAMRDLLTANVSGGGRRWILNAAEAWGFLYPEEFETIRPHLGEIMLSGELDERLQAWIALVGQDDRKGRPRTAFPLPDKVAADGNRVLVQQRGMLHSPPRAFGSTRLVNEYSAAASLLGRLDACGFDFYDVEGDIGAGISQIPGDRQERTGKGPNRRYAFMCGSWVKERVISQAIIPVLSKERVPPESIHHFAQGLLGNEDPWIVRLKSKSTTSPNEAWPKREEYSFERQSEQEVKTLLTALAVDSDVPQGWSTFAAKAYANTDKRDFVLRLWHENTIAPPPFTREELQMCPSGRTFLWWLGNHLEPGLPRGMFVSAFFVGGLQRLRFADLEIIPSKAWRTSLGWHPSDSDPFSWHFGNDCVARFERVAGPLKDSPIGPLFRQPYFERWLVSDRALEQAEDVFGSLRVCSDFGCHEFKE